MQPNYRKTFAIKKQYEQMVLKANPNIKDKSGIYFLTRQDENGINYFYIGKSVTVKSRMVSHMMNYQHIDLSLRKRKFYSEDNPYGWKLNVIYYPEDKLDEMEQYWILEYTKKGYQCRYNKNSGGTNGKEKINEYRPSKGYRDGLTQGYKNASREMAHLFELYLDVSFKGKETVNAKKAMDKFKAFLDFHKKESD